MLKMISHTIPEVLPAAMIRFAASSIETSIPPLYTKQTKLFWNPQQPNDTEYLLNSLGEHLRDERRWLRRRRRLGDTQRFVCLLLNGVYFCALNIDEADSYTSPSLLFSQRSSVCSFLRKREEREESKCIQQ
jgi:hypothetical protein